MRQTRLCAALMMASGGVLLSAGQAAFAQAATQTLERVEVTGSNIRRINSETASPVTTLTRQDIEKSAKTSVAELLQTLSVDNQGSVPKNFGNGFATGASGISLRGLGTASTLVLLNDRIESFWALKKSGVCRSASRFLLPVSTLATRAVALTWTAEGSCSSKTIVPWTSWKTPCTLVKK